MVLESIAEIITACVTRKFRAKTEEEIVCISLFHSAVKASSTTNLD